MTYYEENQTGYTKQTYSRSSTVDQTKAVFSKQFSFNPTNLAVEISLEEVFETLYPTVKEAFTPITSQEED